MGTKPCGLEINSTPSLPLSNLSPRPPLGWKLGTAFHGRASVKKLSGSQLKALEEAVEMRREAGAPVPEPGSLAAQVSGEGRLELESLVSTRFGRRLH